LALYNIPGTGSSYDIRYLYNMRGSCFTYDIDKEQVLLIQHPRPLAAMFV